jgi:hypothetical protein
MRPTTLVGFRAKAKAIHDWYRNLEPDPDSAAGPALWSLVTDLAVEGDAA